MNSKRLSLVCSAIVCLPVFTPPVFSQTISPKGFAPIADRPGDYGVALEVLGGKTRFAIGETLALRFRCALAGHLTLVSIDPAGDVILMYPNKWAPDSKVPAGKTIDIPSKDAGFQLVTQKPTGTTYVRAFMTPKPLVTVKQLRSNSKTEAFSPLGTLRGESMQELLYEIKGFEPAPTDPAEPDQDAIAVVTLKLTITEKDNRPRRADGKILGDIPEGADLDGLTPPANPKAKLLAALRDANINYGKFHEKGLDIPPTFSFDRSPGTNNPSQSRPNQNQGRRETTVEFLVEPAGVEGDLGSRLKSMRIERVRVSGPGGLREARKRLLNQGARSVQPVIQYQLFGAAMADEPLFNLQWALKNQFKKSAETGGLEAMENAVRRPVVVAVVDTGMVANHPDLSKALYRNEGEVPGNGADDDHNGLIDDAVGYDFYANRPALLTGASNNHGTFVASVIGARADGRGVVGVCPWAQILPIRIGGPEGLPTDAIVKALVYTANSGTKIVNCSWGGYGKDPAIYQAMQYLRTKGVLVICAAGNEANDNDVNPAMPASYPLDNLISVAAMRVDGNLASFSNYGANTVHLAAPGELILGYADGSGNSKAWDGTSFSAPMVAGAAALVWSKHPDWTYLQVKDALLSTVTKTDALAGKVITGGMLNIAAAIKR